jgi:hypothetical protein
LIPEFSVELGNREQGTGNREQGTGNREQGRRISVCTEFCSKIK